MKHSTEDENLSASRRVQFDFISDESSFYGWSNQADASSITADEICTGSDDDKLELEARAAAFDVRSYWDHKPSDLTNIAAHGRVRNLDKQKALEEKRIKGEAKCQRKQHNPYEGRKYARQLNETVDEFLQKLPPRSTMEDDVGAWLWITDPFTEVQFSRGDVEGFQKAGGDLLESVAAEAAAVEEDLQSQGKSKLAITKAVNLARKDVSDKILHLGREHGIIGGKWLLRPSPERVNETWGKIAHALVAGKLGYAAKVATNNGGGDRDTRILCVYTYDFEDKEDVKRVARELAKMGFCDKKGPKTRQIYYKCDAYTHLNIMSGNEHGLKTSLYGSVDALNDRI